MSTSFGQSISVTGLQMAQGYLTLLNNGVYKPLRLTREDGVVDEVRPRIYSETAVREVMGRIDAHCVCRKQNWRRGPVQGITRQQAGMPAPDSHRAGGRAGLRAKIKNAACWSVAYLKRALADYYAQAQVSGFNCFKERA